VAAIRFHGERNLGIRYGCGEFNEFLAIHNY
jgi:hypothetical protein